MLKKVKIVATLGSSSTEQSVIYNLAREGVDVFRINLSHESQDGAIRLCTTIRNVERILQHPLAILGDLAGPKIRIGAISEKIILVPGGVVGFGNITPKKNIEHVFSLNFPSLLHKVLKGGDVYLGDGEIKLKIIKCVSDGFYAEVIAGGVVRSKMGFSASNVSLGEIPLSLKDKSDIRVLARYGIDMFAVSFVHTARDIHAVRVLLPRMMSPMIIAKIETRDAVHNSEEICDAADGLMIARGDLGLSIPLPELPHIQKKLIHLALRHGKPVITATQMLESMMENMLPTRAEVTDVANAIVDGTDAVMLSGETARGKYPIETVRMMRDIILSAERYVHSTQELGEAFVTDAVGKAAVKVADQLHAPFIVVFTESGATARRIASHRPSQPVIALSPHNTVLRRLALSWGVTGVLLKKVNSFDHFLYELTRIEKQNSLFKRKKNEPFVVSAGVPFGRSGTTNLLFIYR